MTRPGKAFRRKVFSYRLLAHKRVDKAISVFGQDKNADELQRIRADIAAMAKRYRFSPEEYFLLNFSELTERERLAFISDVERIDIVENFNLPKNLVLFDDKSLTYNRFKKYYHRDVYIGKDQKSGFLDFVKKHNRFIVKPINQCCGSGIRVIDSNSFKDAEELVDTVYSEYKKWFIAEELIQQTDEFRLLHPSSVNSIRITTIRLDDRVEIIHPFLRVGVGENIVDNGGAGGILCPIDINTGRVYTARDQNGVFYNESPDTGEKLIGFVIPEFEEACALVKELAFVVPDNRYTGWDLAHTQEGWVLVEANARGQFVGWQLPSLRGFRQEIYQLVKEVSSHPFSREMAELEGEI